MGQLIHKHFPTVPVTFAFTNRTTSVRIADFIPEKELRRELDHVMTLRLTKEEKTFLETLKNGGRPLFEKDYLDFFEKLELPPYHLAYRNGTIDLTFSGPWSTVTYWETIALSIINELYFRAQMKETSKKEDEVFAEGKRRLDAKIDTLLENPGITFSEFGTRRRFSADWQDYVISRLAQRLPDTQLSGVSNVHFAMKHGLVPKGTNAHELDMVAAGIMQSSDDELRNCKDVMLDLWWNMYKEDLSIILPDTFGSEFVFRTLSQEKAESWKGFRHDSGDPFTFGERVIKFYTDRNIDPRRKLIVFSDGLDINTILALYKYFAGKILTTFGWGTNLTNDLGFKTLSLVVKPWEANGNRLAKLSDNIAKAIGLTETIKRFIRVFEYDVTYDEKPTY